MLPHIKNSAAGVNLYDPVHKSLFELYFSLPPAVQAIHGADEALITEHVLSIGGLDALNKAPGRGEQKFMGSTRSFLNPKLDNTNCEFEVKLSLNLREATDNYIYKIFKSWSALGYDMATGASDIKANYVADSVRIVEYNRRGDIYRKIKFMHVFLFEGITGLSDYEYTSNDAVEITIKFNADWWIEELA